MINFSSVLYNHIKVNLAKGNSNSIDILENLLRTINKINTNVLPTKENAIVLRDFLNSIGKKPIEVDLNINKDLDITVLNIFQLEPFKSGTLLKSDTLKEGTPVYTLLLYIVKYLTTEINFDNSNLLMLTELENDEITDEYINNFISLFNDISNNKSLLTILNFIFKNKLTKLYRDSISGDYNELNIPINIYNKLNDTDLLNKISSHLYTTIYKLLDDQINQPKEEDSDKKFIDFYLNNILKLDINVDNINGDSILNNLPNENIDLSKYTDVFKKSEKTVKDFLNTAKELNNISKEQFDNWNSMLSDIIKKLINNESAKANIIEVVKQSLNKDISIVVDTDGTILNKNIRTIFTGMSTKPGLDVLNAKDGEKRIGDLIIDEYNNLLLNSGIKVNITNDNNNFFKSLLNLLSDDDEKINEFFNWIDDKSKLNDCYTLFITLLENKKVYSHLSSYYAIMYVKFMLTN